MYTTVTIIVDGCLEDTNDVEEEYMMEYMQEVRAMYSNLDVLVEVYLLDHDHEYAECDCISFVADHHPAFVLNSTTEEEED